MATRCGIDIVYIPALKSTFRGDTVLKKFFHADELRNSSLEHLAGVLAAKEAFFKALGTVPKFTEVQVRYGPSGRPYLVVAPEWLIYKTCDVSISHDNDYAAAMVIMTT